LKTHRNALEVSTEKKMCVGMTGLIKSLDNLKKKARDKGLKLKKCSDFSNNADEFLLTFGHK